MSFPDRATTSTRSREAGASLREWRNEIVQGELLPILEQIQQITLGERGEQVVGAVLDELRSDGYRVVHAIRYNRGDIDHVLVGPAGVFVFGIQDYLIIGVGVDGGHVAAFDADCVI